MQNKYLHNSVDLDFITNAIVITKLSIGPLLLILLHFQISLFHEVFDHELFGLNRALKELHLIVLRHIFLVEKENVIQALFGAEFKMIGQNGVAGLLLALVVYIRIRICNQCFAFSSLIYRIDNGIIRKIFLETFHEHILKFIAELFDEWFKLGI